MQSSNHRDYYHNEKGKKQEDESPTTTIDEIEEQKGEIIDSAAVKNKKRVHYPQISGEHTGVDTEKTDSLQQNKSSGK